jgi:hypothetical protein
MAFQYQGLEGLNQSQTIDYSVPQQQSQKQGGGGGMGGLGGMAQMFGGEGSAAGGGAAATTGGGGAAGAGAGSGGGSMMASAGPWAALAAVIIGNESEAKRGGYRSEDDKEYAKDIVTGEVLQQDVEERWLPKIFGEDLENDKTGMGGDTLAATQFATGDFGEAWNTMKDSGVLGKILDIF